MIPNAPSSQCHHRDIYYSAEHDNFYCGHCHQTMGFQFHNIVTSLRRYIDAKTFKPFNDEYKSLLAELENYETR